MTAGSCPRCRSVLEQDASFCHSCGLDLHGVTARGPAPTPAPAPYQPGFAPFPMLPAPGLEVPANPLGHERALAAIAGVTIFFNASIILIFGIIYLAFNAVGFEEVWQGGLWSDQRVIYWEWVLAGVLMLGSFGAGIAGGIVSIRATRFPLAMVSATLLLTSAIIIQWDFQTLSESYGEVTFVLVLSLLSVALLVMSRPVFTAHHVAGGKGSPPYATDNYGWSTVHQSGPPGVDQGPKGVGP